MENLETSSLGLATIERVREVKHHPNADRLDIVKILGYDAIVGRDQFKVNDLVIFIQPDSILPADRDWAQQYIRYTSRGRLRAVRLRGEWSMGLVMNCSEPVIFEKTDGKIDDPLHEEGSDVTELLGVTKFEPKLPNNLHAKGGLPFRIPKTDETRWQSVRGLKELFGELVDVTLKIDGQSATYYCVLPGHWPEVFHPMMGLCSRSLELKAGVDENGVALNSTWHEAERKYDILNRLRGYCEERGVSLALRGEVYGRGIQSFDRNPHSKEDIGFAAFSVYNIGEKRYENVGDEHYFLEVAIDMGIPPITYLEKGVPLTQELIDKYDHELKEINGQPFEGVVIKHKNGSFKIINKWYDAEKE